MRMPAVDSTTIPVDPIGPRRARWTLGLAAAAAAFFAWVSCSDLRSGFADAPKRGAGDIALYQAEVQRMRSGEGYYQAAAAELQAFGYPTKSVFNWRTPLPVALVAGLPTRCAGRALLAIAAIVAGSFAFVWVARGQGLLTALLAAVFLTGALYPAFVEPIYILPEVWAGVLLLLSLGCYGLDRPAAGVACGLGALFFRELAAPYCAVCFALAWRVGRRQELAAWFIGGAAYGLFYLWHVVQVQAWMLPGAREHAEGWLQMGGGAFVISLAQMNAFLLVLPQWVAALFLAAALVGFASLRGEGERLALSGAAFLAAFAFIGQPFNQYWGALIAPLLALGAAAAPAELVRLYREARGAARRAPVSAAGA